MWYHMDDFDPKTGESTLQLVKTLDHQDRADLQSVPTMSKPQSK